MFLILFIFINLGLVLTQERYSKVAKLESWSEQFLMTCPSCSGHCGQKLEISDYAKEVMEGLSPGESACHCDVACVRHKDCCPDFSDHCPDVLTRGKELWPNIQTGVFEAMQPITTSKTTAEDGYEKPTCLTINVNGFQRSIYGITTCGSTYCIDKYSLLYREFSVPVIDGDTGVLYINMDCAVCNNVKNPILPADIQLLCIFYEDIQRTPLESLLRTENGEMTVTSDADKLLVYENCSETELMLTFDESFTFRECQFGDDYCDTYNNRDLVNLLKKVQGIANSVVTVIYVNLEMQEFSHNWVPRIFEFYPNAVSVVCKAYLQGMNIFNMTRMLCGVVPVTLTKFNLQHPSVMLLNVTSQFLANYSTIRCSGSSLWNEESQKCVQVSYLRGQPQSGLNSVEACSVTFSVNITNMKDLTTYLPVITRTFKNVKTGSYQNTIAIKGILCDQNFTRNRKADALFINLLGKIKNIFPQPGKYRWEQFKVNTSLEACTSVTHYDFKIDNNHLIVIGDNKEFWVEDFYISNYILYICMKASSPLEDAALVKKTSMIMQLLACFLLLMRLLAVFRVSASNGMQPLQIQWQMSLLLLVLMDQLTNFVNKNSGECRYIATFKLCSAAAVVTWAVVMGVSLSKYINSGYLMTRSRLVYASSVCWGVAMAYGLALLLLDQVLRSDWQPDLAKLCWISQSKPLSLFFGLPTVTAYAVSVVRVAFNITTHWLQNGLTKHLVDCLRMTTEFIMQLFLTAMLHTLFVVSSVAAITWQDLAEALICMALSLVSFMTFCRPRSEDQVQPRSRSNTEVVQNAST